MSSSSPVSLPDSACAIRPACLRKRFSNFSINTALPAITNPCNTSVFRNIFMWPQVIQGNIVDKDTIDEIIFRTTNTRNRLMLELMARGGMRVGEVNDTEAIRWIETLYG